MTIGCLAASHRQPGATGRDDGVVVVVVVVVVVGGGGGDDDDDDVSCSHSCLVVAADCW